MNTEQRPDQDNNIDDQFEEILPGEELYKVDDIEDCSDDQDNFGDDEVGKKKARSLLLNSVDEATVDDDLEDTDHWNSGVFYKTRPYTKETLVTIINTNSIL